jgi:oxygen-independent coproporphyrinogen-3 oxidase
MTPEYSLYVHIPFCLHRCAYCDFNTYAWQESLIPAYVDALCREIEFVGSRLPSPPGRGVGACPACASAAGTGERSRRGEGRVHTIFFGGGTPSLLAPKQFEQILRTLHDHFDLSEPETSLEANPGTVTLASLRDLRRMGFNRISFGIQSAHPDELRQLERIHNFFDVINSVKWARQAGFDNLNLDLIFGLPEQSLDRWQATVRSALVLRPEHLSLYALTLEHGTPFGRWAARGLLPTPDPDLAAEMYEWAGEYLETNGYMQYEISNWAKDDKWHKSKVSASSTDLPLSTFNHQPLFACRHNLQYWRNQPYLGFGAGAHGYAAGVRYSNVLRIKTYIERCHSSFVTRHSFPLSPATVNYHHIAPKTEMQETMFTGLRLTREGVSTEVFHKRFGVELQKAFGKEIDELVTLGLLEWVDLTLHPLFPARAGGAGGDRSLRLSVRGRLLGNQVFMRFVD